MKRAIGLLVLLCAGGVAAAQSGVTTARPYLWSAARPTSAVGEINVFRRFSAERTAAMREFYGEVLGLPVLPDSALGGGQMIRYPLGGSEVKLFPVAPSPVSTARVDETNGVRVLTFFFADQSELTQRFVRHGHPAPEFGTATSHAGATAAALVRDPDGEWVELVIVPGGSAEQLARFEIGLTVADLAASRAFYGELMGFDAQAPVEDPLLGTTKYAFKHGAATINVWSFGRDLPTDAQTGGMQYIVWNVAAIDGVVRERGAPIDRPLSAPGQMRTLWIKDPDGVSNYFAEFAGNDNSPR